MEKTIDFTRGNVSRQLLKMAFPLIGTSFIQTAYSIVDMIWIGRLGSHAVTAVGTASFLINLAMAISTIIISGTGIKIAHKFGSKELDEIDVYISNGFTTTALLSIVYAGLVMVFKSNIIGFFNINNEWVQLYAEKYLFISMLGVPIMFMNLLFSSMMNSHGNSERTFKINSVGLVVNIILDPLLIFGIFGIPQMGVEGAAIASVVARSIVFILYIKAFDHKRLFLSLNRKVQKSHLYEVIKLGLPNTIQRVVFILIAMILARFIGRFGVGGIAVQKIGLQVEAISYMTIGGLHGAVAIFIGQNFGNQNFYRIKEGYRNALLFSLCFGVLTTLIFLGLPRQIMTIFIHDLKTIEMGVSYLRIIGLSQMFMCVEIVTMASFNGVGKTHIPAIVSLTFTSLRIPVAILFSSLLEMGVNGVWWSISISSVVKGIVLLCLFEYYLNKKIKEGAYHNVQIKSALVRHN